MGKRGKKPSGKIPPEHTKPFLQEIDRAAASFDFALVMYSLQLQEYGLDEREIARKVRKAAVIATEKAMGVNAVVRDRTLNKKEGE